MVIADVYSASYVGRTMPDHETDGWVLLHQLRHGSWSFGHPDGRGEDVEPRLAPALARAAMEIADQRLTDPDLTPTTLARQLNVSVRTLHRAFATAGETLAAYIRRRRLEHARLELGASAPRRPGLSEVAARYQFADGSHFIRVFKAQYGQTPGEFARTPRGEAGARTDSARRSDK